MGAYSSDCSWHFQLYFACPLAIPYLMPMERLQQAVATKLSVITGQTISFSGASREFSFPLPRLILRNVQIMGRAPAPVLLDAPRLEAELSLWGVLKASPEIISLTLQSPKINLAIDEQGAGNWRESATNLKLFDGADGVRHNALDQQKFFQKLGTLRVVEGTLNLNLEKSKSQKQIQNINITLFWPDLTSRLRARGDFIVEGDLLKFTTDIQKPAALFQKDLTPIELYVDTEALKFELIGEMFAYKTIDLDGRISLSSPSLRELSSWFVKHSDDIPTVGPVKATARLRTGQDHFVLENTELKNWSKSCGRHHCSSSQSRARQSTRHT